MNVSNLIVDGTLTVRGQTGSVNLTVPGGAGAGGSLWIITNGLSGSGLISAAGGNDLNTTSYRGGGGGGGRLSLNYSTSTYSGSITSAGGTHGGNGTPGSAGSLCINGGGGGC